MSSNPNFAADSLTCGSKPWSYVQLCAVVSLAFILYSVFVPTTVLERKMSMRRPRQELIEQGVLKELSDNGRREKCVCLACVRSFCFKYAERLLLVLRLGYSTHF